MSKFKNRISSPKPLLWVPSLYLGEALPYTAVMIISLVLYQEMGLSDTQITLYTGWLSLPWVIKPIWSPFIDSIRTKRWWILAMQFNIGVALALVAFTLPTSYWLQASLALFMLVAFSSATHDISADGFYILGLTTQDQELYVGVRNTFYRIGMVVGQGLLVMWAGWLQGSGLAISVSWSITFLTLAIFMILLFLYHSRTLPVVEKKKEGQEDKPLDIWKDFILTFKIFFQKPHIVSALAFILLFRLPEGLLIKIVPLFLKRTIAEGGLQLTDVQYGAIQGTLGVIGLLGGGLIGGWLVSRYGLKKCLWPLVCCITLPDIVYVFLSIYQPSNLSLIGACIFFEQVGYGLGFTAYTLFLVSFSHGERSTSVFSICTAFQFLGGFMIPGMISGWMSESLGYTQFFIWVMVFCLVTFAVTALVHIPEEA